MLAGNELVLLAISVTVVAVVVWGVFLLIRKAVQSGVERGRSDPGA